MLYEWKHVQQIYTGLVQVHISNLTAHWYHLLIGRLKCNVDVVFSSNLNMVGIDLCIRDKDGHFEFTNT